ncbi:MAG: hypothetical protein NZ108_00825, partial [Bacteroidia bacterium]|nr:hypothetical protein [Bacteroidia bacterium]
MKTIVTYLLICGLLFSTALPQVEEDDVYATPADRKKETIRENQNRSSQNNRKELDSPQPNRFQEQDRRDDNDGVSNYDETKAEKKSYADRGYYDNDDDFYYSRRLRRFHGNSSWDYYSPAYINPNFYYGNAWNGWYDPWYDWYGWNRWNAWYYPYAPGWSVGFGWNT